LVNGKDYIPYMKWKIKIFETTNQITMKYLVYTLFSDKHIRLSNRGNYPAKLSMTGHEGTDVSK
jgi:hypothetical protein